MITQKNNMEIKVCVLALSLALAMIILTFFIVQPAVLRRLAVEDGFVENLSAMNWLLASIVMFVLFFNKKNKWYLLLALLFVVCFGEEISWGQRLFGFSGPEVITESNFQGEFNLHNLNFFDRRHGEKNNWMIMYDIGRLFAIFWFLYGCVLPNLIKISARVCSFVHKIRLPIMPFSVGVFFLINYFIFQYFEDFHPVVCAHFNMAEKADYSSLPVELREWYESLVFLVFAVLMLAQSRREVMTISNPTSEKPAQKIFSQDLIKSG